MKTLVMMLSVLFVAGCGDNDTSFDTLRFLGTWEYIHGSGHYFCDNGQAGDLRASEGFMMQIVETDDEHVFDYRSGDCSFWFEATSSHESHSLGETCFYHDTDAWGSDLVVERTVKTDSTYTFLENEVLLEVMEQHYKFSYPSFSYECEASTRAQLRH